jgi:membrane protein YqaA with SNARE-associated domain
MIVLESCIFPIPPDPFFMVKGLNNIKNIWKLALICAILSTIGGCLMYWVGAWVYGHFAPNVIAACGGQKSFLTIQYLVAKWGPLAILGKTISPVPYKLLALVSGISQFSLHIFIATSFISRGIRFFALAGLLIRYQEHANRVLKKYQSWISYGGYALVAIGGLIMLVGFLVNK